VGTNRVKPDEYEIKPNRVGVDRDESKRWELDRVKTDETRLGTDRVSTDTDERNRNKVGAAPNSGNEQSERNRVETTKTETDSVNEQSKVDEDGGEK
jgi:hypothetical protein